MFFSFTNLLRIVCFLILQVLQNSVSPLCSIFLNSPKFCLYLFFEYFLLDLNISDDASSVSSVLGNESFFIWKSGC